MCTAWTVTYAYLTTVTTNEGIKTHLVYAGDDARVQKNQQHILCGLASHLYKKETDQHQNKIDEAKTSVQRKHA